MTAELIAIIAAAISLGGLTLVTTGSLRSDFRRLTDQVADVDRRVARLEGMIDTLQSVILAGRRPTPTKGPLRDVRDHYYRPSGIVRSSTPDEQACLDREVWPDGQALSVPTANVLNRDSNWTRLTRAAHPQRMRR